MSWLSSINNLQLVKSNVGHTHTEADVSGVIPLTQKGVANGVASLGADGLVPLAQLPAVLPNLSASIAIAAMTGTSLIPFTNTTPLVTAGTQIASVGATASSPSSKLAVEGSLQVDCSASNRNLALSFFRNSTCVGVVSLNFISAGRPQILSFAFVDTGYGASFGGAGYTYSLRIGASAACTWYVNRMATQVFNGMQAESPAIFWEYL